MGIRGPLPAGEQFAVDRMLDVFAGLDEAERDAERQLARIRVMKSMLADGARVLDTRKAEQQPELTAAEYERRVAAMPVSIEEARAKRQKE